ncbi:PfaD family polyunsaturated fatty acid/polyketide biosynthesis protein [Kitasatospora sp. NPDC049285]|uniref:PfaD family polyunsaturated fatty acid/polyketide biosynthesis protein n=1 Tax=Kitasatospora sp. NPDC049285 TaxID=3157096 RepID=UPI003419B48D
MSTTRQSAGGQVLTSSGRHGAAPAPAFSPSEVLELVERIRTPVHLVRERSTGRPGLADASAADGLPESLFEIIGSLPALYPEWLGDRSFCETHRLRFPYLAGEMANGIATVEMVTAMAEAEMMGFFGAGGLGYEAVARGVDELTGRLRERTNWGVNLIHSPNEPAIEERVADLLIRTGVPRISASAFMDLTPAVVRCALVGLTVLPSGEVARRVQVFAKVSRPEVAEKFMSPAPGAIVDVLLRRGEITPLEAELAARVPVADDVTVESDSGGHTDNRPLAALLPAITDLRDVLARRHGFARQIRIGAAGGLGTPAAVAGAFALGAAYVVTGSVNQTAREAGLSEDAKTMLAQADLADVTMAPAADMFELGVKLQVLRRGTLFPARAAQLYNLYTAHPSLEAIPAEARTRLEQDVLRAPIDEIWRTTREFWQRRDPAQLTRAEHDPKHRMALVFRWYLGNSSRWAIQGTVERRSDYQIWCGPAMGAFNRWTADSFLAEPENRTVVQIARNLMEGAAVAGRAHQVRNHGVPVPSAAFSFRPRRLA